jgi:hypothetical protein
VTREVYWLRTLGKLPSMMRFLPRLLREGTLPCGRRFLTMSVLPTGQRSSRFGEAHVRFLRMLASRNMAVAGWSSGEPFRRLSARIEAVRKLIDPTYCTLFNEVLQQISDEIGHSQIPVCLVHGDFAQWNLRVAGDDLLVFDWEYAEEGGNPLHDYLHFHLVERATTHKAIGIEYMRRLIVDAARHASRVFDDDGSVAPASGMLTLHYLLDTVAFYTEASGYLDVGHPVVRAYLQVLEQRHRWLPRVSDEKGTNLGWQ